MNATITSQELPPPIVSVKTFAGFWKRLIALIIDRVVVSIGLFPFIFIFASLTHDLILVKVPFDLFTTTTTLSQNEETVLNEDKSTTVVIKKRELKKVLNRWNYLYEKKVKKNDGETKSEDVLIDEATGFKKEMTTSDDLEWCTLLIYWVLLERSRLLGSIGKWIMGIQVVDLQGEPLSWGRSIQRNLLKILSAVLGLVGFMMAGWTQKKQGLHDMISKSIVVNR